MTTKLPLTTLAAALALAACSKAGQATLPAAPPAEVAAVGVKVVKASGDGGALLRATGELRARHEAAVCAEVGGRILRFAVDVGSRVQKGEVLMELDASGPRIQVQQAQAARAVAEAALRSVQADLRRVEQLVKGDAASAASLEKLQLAEQQAAAAVQQADVAVAAAEDHLAKNTVRAPFDGVITSRQKSAGEYVSMTPPTQILTMLDVATIEVRAPVPEAVVDLLAPGDVLDATVSPSGKPFRAKVRAIGSAVDAGARTVEVRADPVGPLFKELRPGAIVDVRLGARSAGPGGVFLPVDTVRQEKGQSFVWAVVADAAQRREVKVERISPGTVRVVSGVAAGDLVVGSGGAGLADGAKVRVLE
jgi:RND family efflux transporter MFP subunit